MLRILPIAMVTLIMAALPPAGPARADIDLLAEPPVVQAARSGDTESLRAHLTRGESPHAVGNDGRSALMIAVLAGNRPMVESLMQHDASVIHTDRIGNTALHYAAEGGNGRIVRLLLEHDADADATNAQGLTPLMLAARHRRADAAQALLDAGANIDRLDYTGRSALMWAEDSRAAGVAQLLRTAGAQ
jgi:ankyrin repeat protein